MKILFFILLFTAFIYNGETLDGMQGNRYQTTNSEYGSFFNKNLPAGDPSLLRAAGRPSGNYQVNSMLYQTLRIRDPRVNYNQHLNQRLKNFKQYPQGNENQVINFTKSDLKTLHSFA